MKYNENGETREYYRTPTGHKMRLPIYYRNKRWNDDEREKLWIKKLDQEIRWVGGEKIKVDTQEGIDEYWKTLEYYRRKNNELGFGNGTKDWSREKYENDRRILLTEERITTAASRRGASPTGEAFALDDTRYAGKSKIKWGMMDLEYITEEIEKEEPDWVTEQSIKTSILGTNEWLHN